MTAFPGRILKNESPWIAARGIWLLPYLGKQGINELKKVAIDKNRESGSFHSVALRSALRYDREGLGWEMLEMLSGNQSSHVRRIALTHLRDFSYE